MRLAEISNGLCEAFLFLLAEARKEARRLYETSKSGNSRSPNG
jgi:hypothetical protein